MIIYILNLYVFIINNNLIEATNMIKLLRI